LLTVTVSGLTGSLEPKRYGYVFSRAARAATIFSSRQVDLLRQLTLKDKTQKRSSN
jgi:hypothetical protein